MNCATRLWRFAWPLVTIGPWIVMGVVTSMPVRSVIAEEIERKGDSRLFDQAVWGRRDNQPIATAQARLDRLLKQRIAAVDRICELNEVQRRKLELAGRGTIRQLFKNIDELRTDFLSADQVEQNDFIVQKGPEIKSLRTMLRSSPFDEDSLLEKTLRTILTPEQTQKVDQRSTLAATSSKTITAANIGDLVRVSRLHRDFQQIAWNRDGTRIGFLSFNHHAEIWLLPAHQVLKKLGEGKRVVGFDFSPLENIVAISENSQIAKVMNLTDQTELILQTGQPQPSVRFSPDGLMIATGGYGTKAILWSTTTGERIREFDVGPEEGGLTPVFSPDGKILAVGHRNSTTRLFDVASGRLLHTLGERMTQGLSFDPTGKSLVVTYVNGNLGLWDVQTGQLKHKISSRSDELYTVDWSPDGRLLVTAGHFSQVTFWNATDLSILSEVNCPESVYCVRFSPNGTRLLFAGSNGTLGEGVVETWAVP